MAIGKFMPGKADFQLVLFRFEHGKTLVKFYEKIVDSRYLFPVYALIIPGQLQAEPQIIDFNNDSLDDIRYKTTSDSGIIFYEKDFQRMIKIKEEVKKKVLKKNLTKDEELKLMQEMKE